MTGEASERVCPFCGEPPGGSAFCTACGRNLTSVDRLPTRAERARADSAARSGEDETPPPSGDDSALAARCAEATSAFLAAMRAAGNPGVETFPTPKPSAFRRAGRVEAWVLWPVDREDFEKPKRYEPGLLLSVEGRFHRLDSELRGWGQRNFPYYAHTASLEPIEMPVGERLLAALAAARAP